MLPEPGISDASIPLPQCSPFHPCNNGEKGTTSFGAPENSSKRHNPAKQRGPNNQEISFSGKLLAQVLIYMKIHMRLLNWLNATYFTLQEEGGKPQVSERPRQGAHKTALMGTLGLLYTMLTGVAFATSMGQNQAHEKLMALCFIICWLTCLMMYLATWRTGDAFCALFNGMIRFEASRCTAKGSTSEDSDSLTMKTPTKLLRACFILALVTCLGVPGFFTILLATVPCIPPQLGYILFKEGDSCVPPEPFALRLPLTFVDVGIWVITFPQGIFYVVTGLILPMVWIDVFLYLLQRKCAAISKTTSIFIYHEIQLIANLFNSTYQSMLLPCLMLGAMSASTIALFSCVKLHSAIPLSGTLLFATIVCDGLSVILATKLSSIGYNLSGKVLQGLKGQNNGKFYRKTLASLHKVKIKFSANFVDRMTPLVFMHFLVSNTVTLMVFVDAHNS